MTDVSALAALAAGLRGALILFAVMILLTIGRWQPDAISPARRLTAQRLNAAAWTLMAMAVLAYSPAHAAWLIGHPTPALVNRGLDALGTALGCASFVKVIAYRGLMRGLPWSRVVRGMLVNGAVLLAMVGAAWLTR